MGTHGPQGKHDSFLNTITSTYTAAKLDISPTGNNIRSRGLSILNMDAAIVVTFSWDGVSDEGEIDPADSNSITFDNFYPPNGTVWLKSASGTPRCQIHAWA